MMDPSQDMLVLMDDGVQSVESPDPGIRVVKIYIQSLSSGDPHPLALHSPFQLVIYRAEGSCSYIVHDLAVYISGRTLALLFKTCAEGTEIRQILRSRVVIWDWISGQMVMDSSLCFDAEFEFSSREYVFGLFDSRTFFVASPAASGSIRIYKLSENCMSKMDDISAPIHLATFHLPPLVPGSAIRRVEAYSGPIENCNPFDSLPKMPFLVNDDDRLHFLSLLFEDIGRLDIDPPHTEFLQIFFHQRIFTKNTSYSDSPTPLDVPWHEWGPENTRIVYPGFLNPYFPRYIHGQRAIFSGPTDHVGGEFDFSYTKRAGILDFSLTAVSFARASSSRVPPDVDSNALLSTFISSPEMLQFSCKEPTLLPPSTVRTSDLPLLVNDLETCLPCVLTTKDFGDKLYAGYMIYGDGILGLDINDEMHLSLDLYHV
ncbi:hypothetical protein BDN70DRAFT_923207 [Pholiota conissans]|uniref:Uncharacterized protein n=1 Tax=Pholiota conissans TaxID=109636 RepID=A0A9P6CXS2_9AGAR|nr:hypothetical protein BDN70DRAFT_923207 [Pholiota conissans]